MAPNYAVEIICAEVLERATRLYFLGERTSQQLEMAVQRRTAQSAAALSIKKLVADLIVQPLLGAVKKIEGGKFSSGEVLALLETVALIHEGALPTVPRVVDPIELSSFLRLGKIGTDLEGSPLVFASERLGTQIYPNSLAGLLRQLAERQMSIAHARSGQMSLANFAESRLKQSTEDTASSTAGSAPFVSIPSIDIDNPRRWPSLWHELGHHALSGESKSLIVKFQEFVDGSVGQNKSTFNRFCNAIAPMSIDVTEMPAMSTARIEAGRALISEWLRECWCDHFGIRKAGLAFLYSQLHDFMFCFENYLSRRFIVGQPYPPAIFRLRLAKMLAIERLRTRNPHSEAVEKLVNEYEREQAALIEICGANELVAAANWPVAMRLLYNQFLAFFKYDDEKLPPNEVIPEVDYESLSKLWDDLKDGLPVPAISASPGGIARAATCPEIVLAGWRDHFRQKTENSDKTLADRGGLRSRLFLRLKEFSKLDGSPKPDDLLNACRREIERSGECLKRSIQVSEWFSILHGEKSEGESLIATLPKTAKTELPAIPGLIHDVGIFDLLDRGIVKVVPLIDAGMQVKGSSIDLRLGHNFEIFSSPSVTAIDACLETNEITEQRQDSLQVEVDLLRGRPIFPGQFILGHTLKYIKLPGDIAAQIEGRSSFARLGIQVHMTANLVEAGFEGCLTLEILNSGHSTFILYPGMRIAQLRLFRLTDHVAMSYDKSDNKYRGQLSQNRTKQFSDREVDVFRRL